MNKHFHLGIASLMTIFIVLCLVTFSLLSLSSSKANLNYSNQLFNSQKSYLELRNEAYKQLNSLQQNLIEIDQASNSTEDYFTKVNALYTLNQDIYYFEVTNDSFLLQVMVKINTPEINQPYYTLISMNKVNTQDWENDSGTPIL